MSRWMCKGSVRGACGVKHKTREAAERHCEQDHRGVVAGNGKNSYSDRYPVEIADDEEGNFIVGWKTDAAGNQVPVWGW